MKFRALRADEVDVRIGTVKQNGVSLLLYKDARCDMNVLDETVGSLNWQKQYSRDNANCTVSIWDEAKKQWVSKEDTGTESYTEAEKGLASDSFKRACFNWGIGRELYTAPFIWISGATKSDRFWVRDMEVEGGKITNLTICKCNQYGDKLPEVAYTYPHLAVKERMPVLQKPAAPATTESLPVNISEKDVMTLEAIAAKKNVTVPMILAKFHIKSLSQMDSQMYVKCLKLLDMSTGGQTA